MVESEHKVKVYFPKSQQRLISRTLEKLVGQKNILAVKEEVTIYFQNTKNSYLDSPVNIVTFNANSEEEQLLIVDTIVNLGKSHYTKDFKYLVFYYNNKAHIRDLKRK